MTLLDWIVILILAASVILGFLRGLVAEVFSLSAWIVAFLAAKWGAAAIGPVLPIDVQDEGMRYFAGFVVIFLVMVTGILLLGRLTKGVVAAVGLGGLDKAAGGLFGLLRGLVILAGLSLAAGLTALPQTAFWKNALSSRMLGMLAMTAMPLLPSTIAEHVHFDR